MKELAHFLQFLSFSIGLLAIYIGYHLLRHNRNKALKKYLYFIIGVNIIVFVHVLEAFFKIIINEETYNNSIRIVFLRSMIPLALLRLYMAALFIVFCRELVGLYKNRLFFQIALGLFIAFVGFIIYIFYAPVNMSGAGEITLWTIHLILFLSIASGAVLLFRHSNKTSNPRIVNYFAFFFLFYSFAYLFSRTINTWMLSASEHQQMASLGFLALLFNSINVIALRKLFHSEHGITSSANNDEALFALYTKYSITSREQEIIELICKGKTNKEIAEILFISPITVRDHNSNIFRKTHVKNRTQLAGLFQSSFQ